MWYFKKVLGNTYGGLAQLGERLPCKQEVTSSTLVFSTTAAATEKIYKEGFVFMKSKNESF